MAFAPSLARSSFLKFASARARAFSIDRVVNVFSSFARQYRLRVQWRNVQSRSLIYGESERIEPMANSPSGAADGLRMPLGDSTGLLPAHRNELDASQSECANVKDDGHRL
jgi:hypothetical protein